MTTNVEVLHENVTQNAHNFNKMTAEKIDSLDEAYDYYSIMHYAQTPWKNSTIKFSIKPKKVDENGQTPTIGQLSGLSQGDIKQTNILYNCPKCGRTFRDQSATFTSPNYYAKAGKEFRCEWRISAKDGERIQLNLTDLDIFESTDCQSDYLEIRDVYWHKSPLLGRFCGVNTKIIMITSTGNRMILNYNTNNPEYRGFAVSYTTYK